VVQPAQTLILAVQVGDTVKLWNGVGGGICERMCYFVLCDSKVELQL
jgi:hypothetical protein